MEKNSLNRCAISNAQWHGACSNRLAIVCELKIVINYKFDCFYGISFCLLLLLSLHDACLMIISSVEIVGAIRALASLFLSLSAIDTNALFFFIHQTNFQILTEHELILVLGYKCAFCAHRSKTYVRNNDK